MNIMTTIKDIRTQVKLWKKEGLTVGFVPTMGFLHEGHQSLIERARQENDKVVVSIFVNPTQFGPNEDFEKYPRDLKRDEELCIEAGGDLIFAPQVSEMYPEVCSTFIDVEGLTSGLCGEKRPGHFRGVCTVVSKLFNIVSPDRAYFGEKDAQQLAVIKRMVKDLNFDIEIVGCPIIREEDGLAKSSRNTYLSPAERKAALVLSSSLKEAKKLLDEGEKNPAKIQEVIIRKLNNEPLAKIDYVEIVDYLSLKPADTINNPVLIALAVYIGKTRLIDNFSWAHSN
jgi:pantoate--beta-alanine ligase